MIKFPIAKINIGLQVTGKRDDGFHNIETIFYPIPLQDALEVSESDSLGIDITGIDLDTAPGENLVVKAYQLMAEDFNLPPVHIHLHKNIPVGAGLGGGSSDASSMLLLLNEMFELELNAMQLSQYALKLGSDCPFFISPRPVVARGRGELMQSINLTLSGFHLLIVKPPVHISTAEAYSRIEPAPSRISLGAIVNFHVDRWQGNIQNQFERSVFSAHPEIAEIKKTLYKMGAVFALMSGSGSAVYGLFRSEKRNFEANFPAGSAFFKMKL